MKKRKIILLFLIVAAAFLAGIAFYAKLPPRIVSHWNAAGAPNGFMPKFWGVFLIPLLMLGLIPLLILLPKIDPLHRNVEKFYGTYLDFLIIFTIFMFFIEIYLLLWNIGIKLNANAIITILTGILFYFVGTLLEKAKQNWFIGVRTPWTLSSEKVWNKTHKLGALLFKISALFAFVGAFFGKYAIYFILIPIFAASIYLFIYSYKEYQKELKQ